MGCATLKINVQLYKMGEGQTFEKEAIVVSKEEAEKAIEEMTAWIKEQLTEAMKQGEDVEILLGRKTNESKNYTV